MLDDLAVLDPVDNHAVDLYRGARSGNPKVVTGVLAGSSGAADDTVAFGNLVDDHVLAGRGLAEELRRLLHPITVGPYPRWQTSVTCEVRS
jgi:hypothetical protein